MGAAESMERTIVVVVFDGVKLLDAVGPAEVFVDANRFGAHYRVRMASLDGQAVSTSIGTRMSVDLRVAEVNCVDTIVVAGGVDLITWPIDPALVAALRTASHQARRIASVCTGAFVLARAGLLDGRHATTHWRHTDQLARDFPTLDVASDAIFVRDGNVFTSAGVTSGIDLALALVEMDYGAALVRDVARALVVYLKRSGGQSQFSTLVDAEPPAQSPLRKVADRIISNPGGDHRVSKLAESAGLSSRQLNRLFHEHLGMTPSHYVEKVRVDVARAALDAGHSVAESGELAGFGSAETLRRVFRAHLGIAPKAYRARFGTTTDSLA